MNRGDIKAARNILRRLESLEKARDLVEEAPDGEMLSMMVYRAAGPFDVIKAYYPKHEYLAVLEDLINRDRRLIEDYGVDLDA